MSDIHPFQGLVAAMQDDLEYAWGWHCNLAVPMMDVLDVTHEQANQAAALIMSQMFGIDITAHPQFAYAKSPWQEYYEVRVAADREEDAPTPYRQVSTDAVQS